jgi:hypothetical protein
MVTLVEVNNVFSFFSPGKRPIRVSGHYSIGTQPPLSGRSAGALNAIKVDRHVEILAGPETGITC